MFPREHGAWGMLLQPFAAAAILARQWGFEIAAGLIAVLLVFFLREPLLVLARQRWLWRDPHPESAIARRCLLWQVPALGLLGYVLLARLPAAPVLALGGTAGLLTVVAVWAALRNRQRAIWLQVVGAFALSTTSLLAALTAVGTIPPWSVRLWLLLSLHSAAAIFVVHARLAARLSAKTGAPPEAAAKKAIAVQLIQLAFAAAVAILAIPALAIPIVASAVLLLIEAVRLRRPDALNEPLRRVGFRMLAIAILHTVVTIVLLWPEAQP
jgi:hypothetical protein